MPDWKPGPCCGRACQKCTSHEAKQEAIGRLGRITIAIGERTEDQYSKALPFRRVRRKPDRPLLQEERQVGLEDILRRHLHDDHSLRLPVRYIFNACVKALGFI